MTNGAITTMVDENKKAKFEKAGYKVVKEKKTTKKEAK